MKNLHLYAIAAISMALTTTVNRLYVYYVEQPATKDQFQKDAVDHDAARFDPKTRAFAWLSSSDRDVLSLPSLLPPVASKGK